MARQEETIVHITSDLTGERLDQTEVTSDVTLTLGVGTKKTPLKFGDVETPFVKAMEAFIAGDKTPLADFLRPYRTRNARNDADRKFQAIRNWARENGHEVNGAGRIPHEVMEAYQAAHPESEAEESAA